MLSNAPTRAIDPTLTELRRHATDAAANAHVPFSREPAGAALLLSDGTWVCGSRLESSTFPLTIPALQAAYVAATSLGRRDILAAASSGSLAIGTWEWLPAAVGMEGHQEGPDTFVLADSLPPLSRRLNVALQANLPASDQEGIALARDVASRAYAPYSDFQVGCVLLYQTKEHGALLVPGVNVEHPDWTRGLCAERSALAAATSIGPGVIRKAFLSCVKDTSGTPCGACRQLLAEVMPDSPLVIDRGAAEPERFTPRELLPSYFSGANLRA